MAIRYLSGINVDSNTLFVDDANNRVGIGTNSPSRQLELVGADAYIQLTRSSTSTQATLGFNTGATNDWLIRTGDGSTSNLQFYSYGTSSYVMTIARSSGNVGIGTTAPSSILHVDGIDPYVRINNVGSANTQGIKISYNYSDTHGFHLLYNGNNAASYVDNTYPITSGQPWGDIYFRQNSAGTMVTRMTIKADGGNVGIGTTSPSDTLDLYQAANTTAIRLTSAGVGSKIYRLTSQLIGVSNAGFGIQNATDGRYELAIDGSGNVGIGTTTVTFDTGSGLRIERSGASTIRLAGEGAAAEMSMTSSGYQIDSRNGYIRFITGAASGVAIERMRITAAGDVGIGIQNPSYLLDVNGSINARSNSQVSGNAQVFTIDGTNHAYYAWSVAGSRKAYAGFGSSGSTTFELINENTGGFIIGTNGGQQLIITSAGNVGIGTTSPSYKASVVAANGNYWNGTAFTGTPLALSIENSQPGGYDPVLIYNQADSGGTLKNSGAIGMAGTGPWTAGNNALQVSDMYFLVRNSSGGISERLRIKSTGAAQLKAYGSGSFTGTVAYNLAVDSSGNIIETAGGVVDGSGTANYVSKWSDANTLTDSVIYDNGTNVGIGTATPGAKLDVSGNVRASAAFISQGGNNSWTGAAIFMDWQNTYGRFGAYNYATNAWMPISLNDGSIYITGANGNVGIGTTSPGYKLDVTGDINFTSTLKFGGVNVIHGTFADIYANIRVIRNASTSVSDGMYIGYDNSGGASGHLRFFANGTNERMRIDASTGNVGIGTTSPASRLHVYSGASSSTAAANAIAIFEGGSNGVIQVNGPDASSMGLFFGRNGAAYYSGIERDGTNLYLKNNSSVGLSINSSNNVGIGTTAPGYRLHVKDSTNVGTIAIGHDLYPGLLYSNAGSGEFRIDNRTSAGAGYITFYPNGQAGTIGSEAMRITTAGNVGIGTTSPAYKLDVSGSISNNGSINLLNTDLYPFFRIGPMTCQYPYNRIDSVRSDGSGYFWGFGMQEGSTNYVKAFFADGARGWYSADQLSVVTFNTNEFNGLYPTYTTGARILANGASYFNGGNVGIGTTAPGAKLQVGSFDAASELIRLSNSYDTGRSARGGINWHDTTNTTGRIYTEYDGTMVSMVFGSLYNSGYNSNNLMIIRGNGNVGIGTTAPAYNLDVQANTTSEPYVQARFLNTNSSGTEYGGILVNGTNQAHIRFLTGTSTWGGAGAKQWQIRAGFGSNIDALSIYSWTAGAEVIYFNSSGNVGIGNTAPSQKLHVTGNIRVTGAYYDSSNSAGSSGQVLSSTGSGTDWVSLSEITGVDGTGTANYIAKWSDTDTITNSQVFDNGTNVGINNASPKTKLDVNGTIGFGGKNMSMTDTFAAALTINMNDHNGCYVKLTAFGDWGNHSTIAYLGEFFIQASAGSYNEPGIIIRQVDNTGGGDDIQAQIVDPAGTGTRDFVIQLKATSASNTPFTAYLQYEVRGLYNSVS